MVWDVVVATCMKEKVLRLEIGCVGCGGGWVCGCGCVGCTIVQVEGVP